MWPICSQFGISFMQQFSRGHVCVFCWGSATDKINQTSLGISVSKMFVLPPLSCQLSSNYEGHLQRVPDPPRKTTFNTWDLGEYGYTEFWSECLKIRDNQDAIFQFLSDCVFRSPHRVAIPARQATYSVLCVKWEWVVGNEGSCTAWSDWFFDMCIGLIRHS